MITSGDKKVKQGVVKLKIAQKWNKEQKKV